MPEVVAKADDAAKVSGNTKRRGADRKLLGEALAGAHFDSGSD
jgi:hypothetical protein